MTDEETKEGRFRTRLRSDRAPPPRTVDQPVEVPVESVHSQEAEERNAERIRLQSLAEEARFKELREAEAVLYIERSRYVPPVPS